MSQSEVTARSSADLFSDLSAEIDALTTEVGAESTDTLSQSNSAAEVSSFADSQTESKTGVDTTSESSVFADADAKFFSKLAGFAKKAMKSPLMGAMAGPALGAALYGGNPLQAAMGGMM